MPHSVKTQTLQAKAIARTHVGDYYLFDWPAEGGTLPKAVRADSLKEGSWGPVVRLLAPANPQPVYEVLADPTPITVRL